MSRTASTRQAEERAGRAHAVAERRFAAYRRASGAAAEAEANAARLRLAAEARRKAALPCEHPPERAYAGYLFNPLTQDLSFLWVSCCECGAVVRTAPDRDTPEGEALWWQVMEDNARERQRAFGIKPVFRNRAAYKAAKTRAWEAGQMVQITPDMEPGTFIDFSHA